MKETIAEMLKIEAQAKELVAAAEAQAAEIERAARTQAAAIQERAQRAARATAAAILTEGLELARKRRAEALAQIDRNNERFRHVPPDRADEAKRLILAALTSP